MIQDTQEDKTTLAPLQETLESPVNLFRPTKFHPSSRLWQYVETQTDKEGKTFLHLGTGPWELPRSSNLPLRFEGRLIGANQPHLNEAPGTNVTIWVTKGGRYITHVHQYRFEPGKHRTGDGEFSSIYRAGVHETGVDALNWLKEDSCKGVLGSASLQAWTMACRHDPALTDLNFEYVE